MIDTTSTYHAAYVVVAIIYLAYSLSLWVRGRRLRERLADARSEPRAE
jgi:hypothetical protein